MTALALLSSPWKFKGNQSLKPYEQVLLRQCKGVELILGSKVRCLLCFVASTTEGRVGEKGESANSRTKHTEPLNQGLISPLYA